MDFQSQAPRVGGLVFGPAEGLREFAYRVRDFFFFVGGYAKKKIAYPVREKKQFRTPQIGGIEFSIFQNSGPARFRVPGTSVPVYRVLSIFRNFISVKAG